MHPVLIPSMLLALAGSSAITSSWLESRLEKFGLRVFDFETTTGRGLQTTRHRHEGEIVISVPEEDAITLSSLLGMFPFLSEILDKSIQDNRQDSMPSQQFTDEQIMAMGLLLLKDKKDTYVMSLPTKQYSVLEMSDDLLFLLPSAYQKLIKAYQNYVFDLYNSLRDAFNGTSSSSKVVHLLSDKADFFWAFATIRSRCVGMDGTNDLRVRNGGDSNNEIRVLLPGFDLLNHRFGVEVIQELEGGKYVIKSQEAYSSGDQVFISYSDKRDNLKMLMTYGFCPLEDNPEAIAFFDVQDLLDACPRARPKYFPRKVLTQLRGLFVKLGQEKGLFRYDGRSKKARPCLVHAINMMAEIENQLVSQIQSEPDHNFREDLLQALLETRIEEIDNALDVIEGAKEKKSKEDEWISMFNSIRNLLTIEKTYLAADDHGAYCDI